MIFPGDIVRSKGSFLEGRRQNDIVNWGLAWIYHNQNQAANGFATNMLSVWSDTVLGMTNEQIESLRSWDGWPADKLETVFEYYHGKSKEELEALFIDVEYDYND